MEAAFVGLHGYIPTARLTAQEATSAGVRPSMIAEALLSFWDRTVRSRLRVWDYGLGSFWRASSATRLSNQDFETRPQVPQSPKDSSGVL